MIDGIIVRQGKTCIISGPSGTGKTTLVKKICKEYPDQIVQSVSCTTRGPRPGEIHGVDYYFIDEKEFLAKLASGEFLEHAKVFDHYYGTLKSHVESLRKRGLIVILVIDVQGAKQLRGSYEADYIFILPPSIEELEKRIRTRQQDTEENIKERLKVAVEEIKQKDLYDRVVINDDFDKTYQELISIIIGESK
jgi:guanylate kinase